MFIKGIKARVAASMIGIASLTGCSNPQYRFPALKEAEKGVLKAEQNLKEKSSQYIRDYFEISHKEPELKKVLDSLTVRYDDTFVRTLPSYYGQKEKRYVKGDSVYSVTKSHIDSINDVNQKIVEKINSILDSSEVAKKYHESKFDLRIAKNKLASQKTLMRNVYLTREQ